MRHAVIPAVQTPWNGQIAPADLQGTGLAEGTDYAAMMSSPAGIALRVASLAAIGALAYHGYRRNNSVGWALAWGIGGGIFWPIALPVAFAQGFGKKRGR